MKRSRKTALVLMGSAPLLLVACARQPEVQTSEGLFTSVEACAAETMNPSMCHQAFEAARAQADAVAPRYVSHEECEAEFGEGRCEVRQHAGGSFPAGRRRPGARQRPRDARLPVQPVRLAAPAGRRRRRHHPRPHRSAARPRADGEPRRLRPLWRRPQRRRLMRRIPIEPRPDWRRRAGDCGFAFHTIDGEPYWDEGAYYAFSLRQVEDDIEGPTAELHAMALDLAAEAA